jgi:hypothetical protein
VLGKARFANPQTLWGILQDDITGQENSDRQFGLTLRDNFPTDKIIVEASDHKNGATPKSQTSRKKNKS